MVQVHVHVHVHVLVHVHVHDQIRQARQTEDCCFKLVGSHQHPVCTSWSYHFAKVSLRFVVPRIHPPQATALHSRENPSPQNTNATV